MNKNLQVQFNLSEKMSVDNRFSYGIIRVLHAGENRNGTYFSREVAEKLVASMRGVPVTGDYNYLSKDFTDHGDLFGAKDNPIPFGFVPFDAQYDWVTLMEDGVSVDYLEIEVAMWTKKYPEIRQFIGKAKNHSMELVPDDMYGHVEMINGTNLLVVDDASGLALTLLGDNTEPCFKSSQLMMFSKDDEFVKNFNQMVGVYNKGGQNKIGGRKVFKFNESIEKLLKKDTFSTISDDTYKVNIMPLESNEEVTYAFDYDKKSLVILQNSDSKEDVKNYSIKEVVEKMESDVQEKYSALVKDKDTLEAKYSEAQSNLETVTEEKETLAEEKKDIEEQFEAQKETMNELIGTNETLEEEIKTLEAYKLEKENAEKEAIVEKYSKILTEEEKTAYSEKLEKTSIKDLKYELGILAYERISDEDGQKVYNLKNEPDSGPTWAQAIKSRRN